MPGQKPAVIVPFYPQLIPILTVSTPTIQTRTKKIFFAFVQIST